MADLIFHYNNIIAFRENKRFLQEQFPKKLTGVQMEKLQTLYEQMIEDNELMQELADIINFSAGKINTLPVCHASPRHCCPLRVGWRGFPAQRVSRPFRATSILRNGATRR